MLLLPFFGGIETWSERFDKADSEEEEISKDNKKALYHVGRYEWETTFGTWAVGHMNFSLSGAARMTFHTRY